MRLTGEQRYRQAMLKTRLQSERSAKAFERGEALWVEGWRTRKMLVAELDRAYAAGLADGAMRGDDDAA